MKIYRTAQLKLISKQEAIDNNFFGPVFHGTSQNNLEKINEEGFSVFIGGERSGDIAHGYETSNYANSFPAPIHHLGFGIYFTTVKNIAKNYNSSNELNEYYLDVPNTEEINFASPNTMMKWWISNGYNISEEMDKYNVKNFMDRNIQLARINATKNLTNSLKSQFDAVWFKGKGLYRLLDGDQICVFDPSKIYKINKNISNPGDVGSKVRRKSDGMIGEVLEKKDATNIFKNFPRAITWLNPNTTTLFTVKWNKGGTQYQVQNVDIDFVEKVKGKYTII